MNFSSFIEKVAAGGGRRGGSSDFVNLEDGTNTFRLLKDGAGMEGFSFFQHWLDRKTSVVCQEKTFGSPKCDHCAESDLLSESDPDRSRDLRAKPSAWLCVVPSGQSKPYILTVSGATMQKILAAAAQVGGWNGEPEWKDEEFKGCMEKGLLQCYGESARDLIIVKGGKGTAPKDMYKVRFSSGKSKPINISKDTLPVLADLFRIIKKIDGDKQEKGATKSPPKVVAKRKVKR